MQLIFLVGCDDHLRGHEREGVPREGGASRQAGHAGSSVAGTRAHGKPGDLDLHAPDAAPVPVVGVHVGARRDAELAKHRRHVVAGRCVRGEGAGHGDVPSVGRLDLHRVGPRGRQEVLDVARPRGEGERVAVLAGRLDVELEDGSVAGRGVADELDAVGLQVDLQHVHIVQAAEVVAQGRQGGVAQVQEGGAVRREVRDEGRVHVDPARIAHGLRHGRLVVERSRRGRTSCARRRDPLGARVGRLAAQLPQLRQGEPPTPT
ncbi:hypothetical protein DFJ74DRAFT_665063 [Hyaloraphidium curvatum]|nr:hypothetical protein DFJ74DRAFT_665063 [Hyaloraphidium curvatum]